MCQHNELAKGYMKNADARRRSAEIWSKISEELNAEGPPIRDNEGWKKVTKCLFYIPYFQKQYFLRFGTITNVT